MRTHIRRHVPSSRRTVVSFKGRVISSSSSICTRTVPASAFTSSTRESWEGKWGGVGGGLGGDCERYVSCVMCQIPSQRWNVAGSKGKWRCGHSRNGPRRVIRKVHETFHAHKYEPLYTHVHRLLYTCTHVYRSTPTARDPVNHEAESRAQPCPRAACVVRSSSECTDMYRTSCERGPGKGARFRRFWQKTQQRARLARGWAGERSS